MARVAREDPVLIDRDIDLLYIGEDLLTSYITNGDARPISSASISPSVSCRNDVKNSIHVAGRKRLPAAEYESSDDEDVPCPSRKRSRKHTLSKSRLLVSNKSSTELKPSWQGYPSQCAVPAEADDTYNSSSESESDQSESDCSTPGQSTSDDDTVASGSITRQNSRTGLCCGRASAANPAPAVPGEACEESDAGETYDEDGEADNFGESDDDSSSESGLTNVPFDPYLFIKNLPPHESLSQPPVVLPPPAASSPKATLVLDLDETLAHSSLESIPGEELVFNVTISGKDYTMHARKRPHLEQFLLAVSAMFEVVVFTASQAEYASKLLDHIDPQNRIFTHRIYREGCVFVGGNYLKDLTVLGRDMSHVVIIDNSPHVFGYQMDNGVPILSFTDCNEDTELLKLLPLLKVLSSADDVRPILRSTYEMYKRVEDADSL
ncbi:CTD small phosphatase [Pelomyxa schiedti]|nr:CTD small phosphatase [Pelomyxa schiedti]